jgi:probable HAF family extracellular repeat protein
MEMKKMITTVAIAVLAVSVSSFTLARSVSAGNISYYVTDLGTLPAGNASSASEINNSGEAVGTSYVISGATNVPHPVLYSDGTVQSLGTLGGDGGSAWAINNAGRIVGTSRIAGNSATHAFLYDGTLHDLGTLPGQTNSIAYGINNAGQIVGEASSSGLSRAFRYDGIMHDLGTLTGKNFATASGINSGGNIVGWSYNFVTSGGLGGAFGHAFLYDRGTMIDLGSLPDLNNSTAIAINDADQVIGYSWLGQLGGGQTRFRTDRFFTKKG